MPLVTTMPEKGQQAQVYDIPDADLQKYEAVEATRGSYDQLKDKIEGGKELAGGLDLDKADVQAYDDRIYICYFWWHGVLYYRWCYIWQDCP